MSNIIRRAREISVFLILLAGVTAASGQTRPTPPTRDPHTPGYVDAKELPDGDVPPADTDGNFIIGPSHNPAQEMTPGPDVPRGTITELVMRSADSKIYPGIARDKDTFGTPDPKDPAKLIVTTSHPAPWTRKVTVYVPHGYVPGTEAPFIVGADGPDKRLFTALDSLIAQKRVPAMIAISINNGGGDAQGSQRGLEYDTLSPLYAEFVETEVLPLVESKCNVKLTKDPDGRATMGSSSGGSCALAMAWYRPDLYRRVLTYSGTYVNQQWPHNPETPHGAWEFHEHLIPDSDPKPIRIWLEVGDRDLLNPNCMQDNMHDWVLANELMAKALAAKGYHYQFVSRNAGHSDGAVKRQTLPQALEYIWQGYGPEAAKKTDAPNPTGNHRISPEFLRNRINRVLSFPPEGFRVGLRSPSRLWDFLRLPNRSSEPRLHRLSLLEIHAANACNLTCESCSHFSNSGHKGLITLEEADRWMSAWNRRLLPDMFRLLGGEPTLNPKLPELLRLSREKWPRSQIALTTNGFFAHRHPSLGKVLGETKALVCMTFHDRTDEYTTKAWPGFELLKKWSDEFGFMLVVEESHSRWTRRHHGSGDEVLPFEDNSPRLSWEARCPAKYCRQLFRGKLWKCSTIAYLQLQKEAHPGISEKWDPYLAYTPLEPDCTDRELARFLSAEAQSICDMCAADPQSFVKPSPLIPLSVIRRRETAAATSAEPQ